MNLKPEEIEELNGYLSAKELNLPEFRREVNKHGGNYQWLQKHICVKNPGVSPRVKELLKIE